MSKRWTDKKRGYAGGSIPSGAQALSFTADQRERLGNLPFLRTRRLGADGSEFGVTRFGNYEKGYSLEPGPGGKEKPFVYVAIGYFKQAELNLMLLRCTDENYTIKNQCTVSVGWSSFSGIIQMANVGVTWDIIRNRYRVFINRVNTHTSSGQEVWDSQATRTEMYLVDTDGNIEDMEYISDDYITGVGRGGIRAVANRTNKSAPMAYYIPGINEVLQTDASFTQRVSRLQTGAPDEYSDYDHFHRIWDITRLGKEILYYGDMDEAHPNIVPVYRENMRTHEIEQLSFYVSDILGYNVDDEVLLIYWDLRALVQGADKIYISQSYRPFGGAITEDNIYALNKDNLREVEKLVTYPADIPSVAEGTQYRTYPLYLAYSFISKLLFVGVTKVTVHRGAASEGYPNGQATAAEKESRIDVFDIEGNLLYDIPVFTEESYPDPSGFTPGLSMFEYSLYGFVSGLSGAPGTAWYSMHREMRIGIVEGAIL